MREIKNKKQAVRLYNIVFLPLWTWLLFPAFWRLGLPANFLIDSLVLAAAMMLLHYQNKFIVWRKSILKIWLIGFGADLAGAFLIYAIVGAISNWLGGLNIEQPPLEQLTALPGVVLAGILIYFLNRLFSFKKTELEPAQIRKLSLILAAATAPYAMLIPTSWLAG